MSQTIRSMLRTSLMMRGAAQDQELVRKCKGRRGDAVGATLARDSLPTDTSSSRFAWQTHDLKAMLLAASRLRVPMIAGSAGDTGTDSRVDLFVRVIQDLARKHALPRFRIGTGELRTAPSATPCEMLPLKS